MQALHQKKAPLKVNCEYSARAQGYAGNLRSKESSGNLEKGRRAEGFGENFAVALGYGEYIFLQSPWSQKDTLQALLDIAAIFTILYPLILFKWLRTMIIVPGIDFANC